MKVHFYNRIAAYAFPISLVIGGGASFVSYIIFTIPIFDRIDFLTFIHFFFGIFAAILLGLIFTCMSLSLILRRFACILNGAPHREGETVVILTGKWKGEIGVILEYWILRMEVVVWSNKQEEKLIIATERVLRIR